MAPAQPIILDVALQEDGKRRWHSDDGVQRCLGDDIVMTTTRRTHHNAH